MRIIFTVLILLIFPVAVQAQEAAAIPAETETPPTALEATRIEVDQDANVIRFFIDGQEAVRIDATGLHVRENIRYGGTIKDTGAQADVFTDTDEKPAGEGE
jgi:hypothetical protein